MISCESLDPAIPEANHIRCFSYLNKSPFFFFLQVLYVGFLSLATKKAWADRMRESRASGVHQQKQERRGYVQGTTKGGSVPGTPLPLKQRWEWHMVTGSVRVSPISE